MDENFLNTNLNDVQDALDKLADNGLIWAICYKCLIFLDLQERHDKVCKSCGKLEPEKILYKLNTGQDNIS